MKEEVEFAPEDLEDSVLHSLLLFDESLRRGDNPASLFLPPDVGACPTLSLGHLALQALEVVLPRSAEVMPSWAPSTIGRFRIDSILGTGGFAIVYQAFDPRLNRQVALKVPRPHAMLSPSLRRRFLKESEAVARLDHPNIVPVFEAGEDRDVPYMACALCEGPSLADWISSRTSPLKPKQAAGIVHQLSAAVQFSHSRGILHRDIKPGNVMLFPDHNPADETFPYIPRLGDFGLAKQLEEEPAEATASQLMGTPRYMAPEALSVQGQAGNPSSDVYSLGALLYALIVGQPPFAAATLMETLRLIAECDPVPPHVISPAVDQDLSLICMKCLEKSPPQRYRTAAELGSDLERYLAGRPVHARQTSLLVRGRKWFHRHPLVATLSCFSAGLLVCLLVLAVRYATSLRYFQAQVSHRNTLLKARVNELGQAVQMAGDHLKTAQQSEREKDQLLFASDLALAARVRAKGDVEQAVSVLKKYEKHDASDFRISGTSHFGWNYLWHRMTLPATELASTGQSVWWLQPVPDNSSIAVCGSEGRLQFLSAGSGNQLERTIPISAEELGAIAFSDDGQLAAIVSDDGNAYVYDAHTWQEKRVARIGAEKVFGVLFLPGQHLFVTCGRLSELSIVDADRGEIVRTVSTPHDRIVECMAFSPDRSRLVTAGGEGLVAVHRIADWSVDRVMTTSMNALAAAQFSADGAMVICGGTDCVLRVFDIATGNLIRAWENLDSIRAIVVTTDNRVVCGDDGGVLALLKLPESPDENAPHAWRPQMRWKVHDAPISAMTSLLAHDSGDQHPVMISADRSGRVRQSSLQDTMDADFLPASNSWERAPTDGVASGPDARSFVRIADKRLEFLSHGAQVGSEVTVPGTMTCCTMVDSTNLLLTGMADGSLLVHDPSGTREPAVHTVFSGSAIARISIDRAGRTAVLLSVEDEMAIVEIASGLVVHRLSNRSAPGISPEGQWIASGRHGTNELEILRSPDLTVAGTLPAHRSTINQIQFLPDGDRLVTCSNDRTVAVWNMQTQALTQRFSGHTAPVTALAVHPDNRTVASGDLDGRIILWDVNAGYELLELDQKATPVTGLRFSRDGLVLAAWDGDLNVTLIRSVGASSPRSTSSPPTTVR